MTSTNTVIIPKSAAEAFGDFSHYVSYWPELIYCGVGELARRLDCSEDVAEEARRCYIELNPECGA